MEDKKKGESTNFTVGGYFRRGKWLLSDGIKWNDGDFNNSYSWNFKGHYKHDNNVSAWVKG